MITRSDESERDFCLSNRRVMKRTFYKADLYALYLTLNIYDFYICFFFFIHIYSNIIGI